MRKKRSLGFATKYFFQKLLSANGLFNFLSDIERVLVLPVRTKHNKLVKQSYVFIFGYGTAIESRYDCVVYWHEKKVMDHRPYAVNETGRIKNPFLTAEMELSLLKKACKDAEAIEALDVSARPILCITIEDIKETIHYGHGIWQEKAWTKNTKAEKKKYLKHHYGVKLFNEVLPHLRFEGAHFLLLRDIFDPKYHLKNTVHPNPYTIVRGFLKFIGVYPERRSGRSKRQRLSLEDERAVKSLINQYGSNSSDVNKAFKDQLISQQPTKHHVRKFSKKK